MNIISDPEHDPRWHVVMIQMVAKIIKGEPKAQDDAIGLFLMPWDSNKFFDRLLGVAQITLKDYREWRKIKRDPVKIR